MNTQEHPTVEDEASENPAGTIPAPDPGVESPPGAEAAEEPRGDLPPWVDATLRRLARVDTVFGSDVYVDYSHRYVWQANQFGHLLIGVVATMLFGWLLGSYAAGWCALILLYGAKEGIDAAIALRVRTGVFPLDRGEILRDGAVDLAFVLAGGLLVLCAGPTSTSGLGWFGDATFGANALPIAIVAVIGFFLVVRRPFLARKGMFDKSGLSQLVRLSTFPDAFTEDSAGAIDTIARFAYEGRDQLVITGTPGAGRSTLAKAIGGDATARLRKVRALSAARLVEKRRVGSEPPSAPGQPWAVGEAELVIVDDIPFELLASVGGESGMVSGLIDPTGNPPSIFEVPLREDAPVTEAARPADASSRPLPAVVWVIDEPVIARRFATKELPARFPGVPVHLIELTGRLSERRAAVPVS